MPSSTTSSLTAPDTAARAARRIHPGTLLLGVLAWTQALLAHGAQPAFDRFPGCCDASAAAPVNESLFAVASDEDNLVRLYRHGTPGPVVRALDLSRHAGAGRREEFDLEGAARLGNLIFWIGSHARNSDGALRPLRQVLLGTSIEGTGDTARLMPFGQPCRTILNALSSSPELRDIPFAAAARRPPEAEGGLNIEGLAEGPGNSLWIAFRNPLKDGNALLVPLRNPVAVLEGQHPQLGSARELPLGGLGIRDILRVGSRYLIIAGRTDGGGTRQLYTWDGTGTPVKLDGALPRGFNAESMVEPPPGGTLLVLADDDSQKIGGRRCQELADPARRAFRALAIPLP